MDNKPLVSILSSVYNECLYIEQTLHSVLMQTYRHWEWIIVDDGSTDGTGEILRSINDQRIKYIYQKNTGYLAKNLNRALAISRGDIIATLDGDDFWPANKIEVQVESFEDPGIVLSYGECYLVNVKGKTIGHVRIPEDSGVARNTPPGTVLKRFLLDIDCFICATSVMYRKESLSSIGGFVEARGLPHDFSTWIKLAFTGRFASSPVILGYYRKHLSSMSFNINQEYYLAQQIKFLADYYRQNVQKLRGIGVTQDLEVLESRWHYVRRKNRIISRLASLALLVRVDFVNPLICCINRRSSIKRLLERLLQV